jgi:lipopolysaccharide transport system ATP-binding protein
MSEFALHLEGAGKMYKIFPSRLENLVDAVGINRVLPFRSTRYREFWAVRDVNLELSHGSRIGVIGRNGAGKSTLLKMITGGVAPTEGSIEINGQVQALLDASAGLHPEFTGRENLRAALTYQGLSSREIVAAEKEILDFTELGDFLDQPFRTYSLGMQARLGFAIATAVRPEILIVDEVLGAGDAYFFAKSTARMMDLVEGGASVLLVSHSLQQVTRFCEETIWMDRGRVVMRGPTVEVVKAYDKYIRVLDDRRLRARNENSRGGGADGFERESYTDQILVRFSADDAAKAKLDVAEVRLFVNDEVEDSVEVGGTQDADPLHSAHLMLNEGQWSEPRREEGKVFRSLVRGADSEIASSIGNLHFRLWFFYPQARYEVEVTYRLRGGSAQVAVGRGTVADAFAVLSPTDDWRSLRVSVMQAPVDSSPADEEERLDVSRWPGRSGLKIDGFRLLGGHGDAQAIFAPGDSLALELDIRVEDAGEQPLILAALIFRDDGLVVTRHVSDKALVDLSPGERFEARLDLGELLLGNGTYLLSVGLYSKLDLNDVDPSEVYDYFDKSYEFRIAGNPALHNEIVRHPGNWRIERYNGPTLEAVEASESAHEIEWT